MQQSGRDSASESDSGFDIPEHEFVNQNVVFAHHSVCRLWEAWTSPFSTVVVKLQRALDKRLIDENHILLRLLESGLDQALRPKSGTFKWPPGPRSFAETLEHLGGAKVVEFVRGPGQKGECEDGKGVDKAAFSFSSCNIPLPGATTRANEKPGFTTSSGVLPSSMAAFMQLAMEPARKIPLLIDNATVRVLPIAASRDGMAIKPGLQFEPRRKIVVGAEIDETMDFKFVELHQQPDPTMLKESLVVEAHEFLVTPMTGDFSMPVATLFKSRQKSGQSTFDETRDALLRITTAYAAAASLTTSETSFLSKSQNAPQPNVRLAVKPRLFAIFARLWATNMCLLLGVHVTSVSKQRQNAPA